MKLFAVAVVAGLGAVFARSGDDVDMVGRKL
jgi:hypothetical protein